MSQIIGYSKCMYCGAVKKQGTWYYNEPYVPEAIIFSHTVCPRHVYLETLRVREEMAKLK